MGSSGAERNRPGAGIRVKAFTGLRALEVTPDLTGPSPLRAKETDFASGEIKFLAKGPAR